MGWRQLIGKPSVLPGESQYDTLLLYATETESQVLDVWSAYDFYVV